jgi:hypothetical protein
VKSRLAFGLQRRARSFFDRIFFESPVLSIRRFLVTPQTLGTSLKYIPSFTTHGSHSSTPVSSTIARQPSGKGQATRTGQSKQNSRGLPRKERQPILGQFRAMSTNCGNRRADICARRQKGNLRRKIRPRTVHKASREDGRDHASPGASMGRHDREGMGQIMRGVRGATD